MTSTAEALRSVLEDLEIRHQVESCVKEMVADVEYAHHLSAQLRHEMEKQKWERLNQAQKQALEESYLERKRLKEQSLPLADALVKDLYETSRELGKYYQLQTKHNTLTQDYDELLAKLLQAEDQIRVLQEEKEEAFRQATEQAALAATSPLANASPEKAPQNAQAEESKTETGRPASAESPVTRNKPAGAPEKEPDTNPAEKPVSPEQPPAAAAAVVSLEVEDQSPAGSAQPRIEEFEDTILMNIFAFLDALEILNTAQINTKMYTRVDALFGLGDGNDDGGNDNTTISSAGDGSTNAMDWATNAVGSTSATVATTSSMDSAVHPGTSNTRQPPTRSNSTGATPATSAQIAPTSPPRDTGLAALTSTQQHASAVMNNVFQFLQPRRGANTSTPTRRGGSSNPPIMNAATASSVASKLTDSELNAILGMMERMRKKEAAVEKLKAENEQLRAEWEGTESVKNFLVQKVRDMEELLTRQEENETKVALQIASDQEVIAFLDARVQELEQQVSALQSSKSTLEQDMAKMRSNLEQRSTVLQDMLQFERERFVEFEKDAKTTKKVLVKEIKLCRSQILALSAERDAYKEQNETLQRAVLHTSGGGAAERLYA